MTDNSFVIQLQINSEHESVYHYYIVILLLYTISTLRWSKKGKINRIIQVKKKSSNTVFGSEQQ